MSDYFVLSSYAYLHDTFYYFWQASFCIVSRLQRHLVWTLRFGFIFNFHFSLW
jgi:hypothetical protein